MCTYLSISVCFETQTKLVLCQTWPNKCAKIFTHLSLFMPRKQILLSNVPSVARKSRLINVYNNFLKMMRYKVDELNFFYFSFCSTHKFSFFTFIMHIIIFYVVLFISTQYLILVRTDVVNTSIFILWMWEYFSHFIFNKYQQQEKVLFVLFV